MLRICPGFKQALWLALLGDDRLHAKDLPAPRIGLQRLQVRRAPHGWKEATAKSFYFCPAAFARQLRRRNCAARNTELR